ncbi:MAG: hypothetical protein PUB89_06965 [Oscillospiraceae bacterium]|nr:hypothetical protein [Oscillospiraceae bacterium]
MIQLHLDTKEFTKKPKTEAGDISKRIAKNITQITVSDLADAVGNHGRSFTPVVFEGGRRLNSNFHSQIVFGVDFDHGWTIEKFFERTKLYGIEPAFVYQTFGYSETEEKFRAVFIHESTIYDPIAACILRFLLIQLFEDSDERCIDAARMFYGGKKLVYLNEEARINIADVGRVFDAIQYKRDANNLSKNMKKYIDDLEDKINSSCKIKFRVKVIKNILQIHCLEDKEKIEEKKSLTHKIIWVDENNSSKVYVIKQEENKVGDDVYSTDRRKNKSVSLSSSKQKKGLRGITLEEILAGCPLFEELYNNDLPHSYEFKIATNLAYVENGYKMFCQAIEGKSDPDMWRSYFKYIKVSDYHPEYCESGTACPHYEKCRCKTLYNKLSRSIKKVEKEKPYAELNDSHNKLVQSTMEYLEETDKGIYLLKAQTSLGKTNCYCQIAKQWTKEKPLLIAVPTNKLQAEVAKKLYDMGIDLYETIHLDESLRDREMDDLLNQIEYLYQQGLNEKVKPTVRNYLKENEKELDEQQKLILEKYLTNVRRMDSSKCVITTHMMFLHLPLSVLEKYEIIIDEDILLSTVFKGTDSIQLSDLYKVMLPGNLSYSALNRLDQIMHGEDGTVGITAMHEYTEEIERWVYQEPRGIQGSLINFSKSSTYKIDLTEKKIDYFVAKQLPNVKMVIVSATVNEEVYRDYCKFHKVQFKEIPLVGYQGKLKQYTAYSMSRSCIDQIGYDKVKKAVMKIVKNTDVKTITFKKYDEYALIYFGLTEGLNYYEGLDIAVIGTPHYPPVVYELIGRHMGYDDKDVMCVRQVVHNGYRFSIMAYKDTKMRNLQFYYIESELEQAIGRARLLRHNCTVYLFSNFPCKQAELITEEYLEGVKDKD